MLVAPRPSNDEERLSSLYEYNILDSIPEDEYDDITRIAADISNMPICLISLIDKDRQWFKSKVGLQTPETHRDIAFCAHAILQPDDVFIVRDTNEDLRFHDNPLVTENPNIGFYAGVPLVNDEGHALGTLCVIDNKPNDLTLEQKVTLQALARQIVAYLEVRKLNRKLAEQKSALEQINNDLDHFAVMVAHDIKSPCSSLLMGAQYLKDIYGEQIKAEGDDILSLMEVASHNIINMVNGILNHTRTLHTIDTSKERFTFGELMAETLKVPDVPANVNVTIHHGDAVLHSARYVLLQILLNLTTNALKYNNKEQAAIVFDVVENKTFYCFTVKDNGIGIREEDVDKIFNLFTMLGSPTRNNEASYGIGLGTVKRMVQKMGGTISVHSVYGEGSEFTFTIQK